MKKILYGLLLFALSLQGAWTDKGNKSDLFKKLYDIISMNGLMESKQEIDTMRNAGTLDQYLLASPWGEFFQKDGRSTIFDDNKEKTFCSTGIVHQGVQDSDGIYCTIPEICALVMQYCFSGKKLDQDGTYKKSTLNDKYSLQGTACFTKCKNTMQEWNLSKNPSNSNTIFPVTAQDQEMWTWTVQQKMVKRK